MSEEGRDHLPSKKKYSDAPCDVDSVPHKLPTTSIITRRKLFNCDTEVRRRKKKRPEWISILDRATSLVYFRCWDLRYSDLKQRHVRCTSGTGDSSLAT